MSILSAIKETQHENKNLEELAKLPQALIMSMAQRGEIKPDMVMPILGKKAEMIEEAAKMRAAQQLTAQGGAQPTVMDQYMGKIAQAEHPAPAMPQQAPQQMAQAPAPQGMENTGVAQLPIPERTYAGGGIIAFGNGGMPEDDEDYQEYIDDAHEAEVNSKLYDMISELKGTHGGVGITAGHHGAERGMEDKGDLESRLQAAIRQKESGGRRYDKHGNLLTSHKGAQGEMQVMPGTARDPGFGIKPAQSNHPDELRRVGDEYASMLLKRYKDPTIAMIAYNMGPGATDRWLAAGADPRKLPLETQNYPKGVRLAGGGEVQHYAAGDYVEENTEYDPFTGLPIAGAETYMPRPAQRLAPTNYFMDQPWQRQAAKEASKKTDSAKSSKSRGKASPEETEAFFNQFANKPPVQNTIPQSPEGIKALQAQAKEEGFDLMDYIKSREAKMDKAAEQDKWLAGLSAGLGMLGGTSPYALTNIGQGGQMGVQQLAASQKNRMAQEAALGKLYGSAAQADLLNKLRRDQLAQGKELKEDQLAKDYLTAKNQFIEKRLKAKGMDEMMLGTLRRQKAMGKLDPAKEAELNYYERQMQDIENEANRLYASPGAGMKIVGVR